MDNNNKTNFAGYCFENGKTRSLIGLPQFHAYFESYKLRITTRPFHHSFCFGTCVHKQQVTLNARIPLPSQ